MHIRAFWKGTTLETAFVKKKKKKSEFINLNFS